MKPVSVVAIYTAKFYHSFFLPKTLCLLKRCIAMNPENHGVNNFNLNFLYFGFIFFLHFSSQTAIIMKIQ